MLDSRKERAKRFLAFATSKRLLRTAAGLSIREGVSIAVSVFLKRPSFYWKPAKLHVERRADGPLMLVHQDLVDAVLDATHLSPTCLVLDIGGHLGQFARCVLRRLPRAEILTFEPNKEALEILEKNLECASHCGIFGVGIGRDAGSQKMFHVAGLSGQNSRHVEAATVRIEPTSDLIESDGEFVTGPFVEGVVKGRKIDLIKIDVEGDEREVLEQVWHLPWVNLLVEIDEQRAVGFEGIEDLAAFIAARGTLVRNRKFTSPTSDGSIYDVLISRRNGADHID